MKNNPTKQYKIANKNIEIKQITPNETLKIRQPILREGRPFEESIFEGDYLKSTLHLGLFLNKKLTGVATFLKHKNPLFKEKLQFQLRGMAVLKKEQKQGLGRLILQEGELLIKEKKTIRIWFNARKTALNFYKKNDYLIIGKPFEVPNIGLHYTMTKK